MSIREYLNTSRAWDSSGTRTKVQRDVALHGIDFVAASEDEPAEMKKGNTIRF